MAASFTRGHDRGTGGTVVTAVSGKHLGLAGVLARHANGVLHSISTAVGEEHVGEVTLCLLHQVFGKCATNIAGKRWVHVGDATQLGLNRFDQLWVVVTQVGRHQLGAGIEVTLAGVVVKPRTRRVSDGQWIDLGLGRPAVEDMPAVVLAR